MRSRRRPDLSPTTRGWAGRVFSVGISLLVLALLPALRPGAEGGSAPFQRILLVDDRGEPLAAPLELCFVHELETECVERSEEDAGAVELQEFDTLRVEGPEHGPTTLRRHSLNELEGESSGVGRLTVPRKARLEVRGLPDDPVTLSLYPVDEPLARRPRFRSEVPKEGMLWIPAGDHLAALSDTGSAPDLHALSASPGGRVRVSYGGEAGWSLALRAVGPAGEEAVPGASVKLALTTGYGEEEQQTIRDARTGPLGFAVFEGLEQHLASATVRHEHFVETEVPGLSAPVGAFDLRHVTLMEGGTIAAEITITGEPADRAVCRIVELAGHDDDGRAVVETVREAQADRSGRCRFERVPAGVRHLRVSPEGRDAAAVVDRKLHVVEGTTSMERLALSPVELRGTVYRGTEAAGAEYRVSVARFLPSGPGGTRESLVEATTDEEGMYQATLWSPGDHYFRVLEPSGTPAASKRTYLGEGEERVDFHLSPHRIEGVVVDQKDRPVEGISVSLEWIPRSAGGDGFSTSLAGITRNPTASHTGTETGPSGGFSFPIRGTEGDAYVSASGRGYAASDRKHVPFVDGVPASPVELRVTELDRLQGQLTTASGVPVSRGWVSSYRVGERGKPIHLATARTEGDGSFELSPAEGSVTLVYASGPGCPLDVFEVPVGAGEESLELHCAPAPATVRFRLVDEEAQAVPDQGVILRRDGVVIPEEVVETHLSLLGLPMASDGAGRLVLARLAPGDYELHLSASANESTVAQGLRHGFLTEIHLGPGAVRELEMVLDTGSGL